LEVKLCLEETELAHQELEDPVVEEEPEVQAGWEVTGQVRAQVGTVSALLVAPGLLIRLESPATPSPVLVVGQE